MTLAPFSSRQRRGGGQLAGAPAYRWDPRREMDEINNRFGQLIQTFFGDPTGLAGAGTWSPLSPPIDVEETEDAYVVDVDLPNVDPQDIGLEMRGEELRISGSFQQRDRGGVVRRQSRQMGDFEYMIDLPSDIDTDRVQATYDNGVLTVTVSKARDAQPRRIEIQGQQGQRQIRGEGQQGQQQTGQQQTGQQQAGQRNAQQQAAGQRGAQDTRQRG